MKVFFLKGFLRIWRFPKPALWLKFFGTIVISVFELHFRLAQFRLAVRGHTLLVLDDSGSRVPLTEAELLGLEIVAKPGSEGIPPMVGLKMAQPQDVWQRCLKTRKKPNFHDISMKGLKHQTKHTNLN